MHIFILCDIEPFSVFCDVPLTDVQLVYANGERQCQGLWRRTGARTDVRP